MTGERAGYDAVADTVAGWRAIVPEPVSYTGVIGSYGNGDTANTTVAKEAFPDATHIVYDVHGTMPSCDILDDEPGDANDSIAPGWSAAHNRTPGPHVLPHSAIYKSASGVAALISTMLDAGYKRTAFLVHSAHYGQGPHICGPGACQYPKADGTQHSDKGLEGQNTDLNLFEAHFFAAPAPDPDARYDLFDDVKRSLIGGATERATVEEYDKWRATQSRTHHPHRPRLAILRIRLRLLAGRLERVTEREGKRLHPNQAWRLRELRDRANGLRLV